jgi:hypothetical protein
MRCFRIDGVNNYLMYSDSVTQWDDPVLLQEPRYSWEFTLETADLQFGLEGWLVITHGVGAMRRYCMVRPI